LANITGDAFANSTQPDLALQIGVLIVAVFISLFIRKLWNDGIEKRIKISGGSITRIIVLRGSKRLSFALTLLIIILLANGVFDALGRPTGIFDLGVPLASMLAALSVLVYLLRVAAGPGGAIERLERTATVTFWMIFVLYLFDWLPLVEAFLNGIGITLGETRITLLGVIKFLIIYALLLLVAMAVSRLLEGRLSTTKSLESGVRMGLVKVIRYCLVGFAVLIALSASGLDLTTLTIIGSALGVGVGFGFQKVASNLISGFLILFDRSVRPGDVISIGNSYGWVEKMGARYIVVRDTSGVDTLIPNEEMITSQVINWSYGDRHIRLKLPVQISYGDDPELAIRLLLEASTVSERVITDPVPTAGLMEFGDNGINLELRVWIDDPEEGVSNVRSDINLAIWRLFKANDISIPFPQRDVHLVPGCVKTQEFFKA
jgi:small-conductance mechanosensitive channel